MTVIIFLTDGTKIRGKRTFYTRMASGSLYQIYEEVLFEDGSKYPRIWIPCENIRYVLEEK